jgi:hypothetical protein
MGRDTRGNLPDLKELPYQGYEMLKISIIFTAMVWSYLPNIHLYFKLIVKVAFNVCIVLFY